MTAHICRRMCN